MKAGKLSDKLSGTFNFVSNHVKKPNLGKQGRKQQLLTLGISKSLQERKHKCNTVFGSTINSIYISIIIEILKSDLTKTCSIAVLAEREMGSGGGGQQESYIPFNL